MIKKFYVDINHLNEYASFLGKCMTEVNRNEVLISRANNRYQSLLRDNISEQVEARIKTLKKIFDNFSIEIDKMSKNVKKDFELYQAYLKGLK